MNCFSGSINIFLCGGGGGSISLGITTVKHALQNCQNLVNLYTSSKNSLWIFIIHVYYRVMVVMWLPILKTSPSNCGTCASSPALMVRRPPWTESACRCGTIAGRTCPSGRDKTPWVSWPETLPWWPMRGTQSKIHCWGVGSHLCSLLDRYKKMQNYIASSQVPSKYSCTWKSEKWRGKAWEWG